MGALCCVVVLAPPDLPSYKVATSSCCVCNSASAPPAESANAFKQGLQGAGIVLCLYRVPPYVQGLTGVVWCLFLVPQHRLVILLVVLVDLGQGGAVHVDPTKPMLKAPEPQRLKLEK